MLRTVWLALLMLYALMGLKLVPFQGDEATLIMMSRDYYYLFVDRDLERVRFHDPPLYPEEQRLRLLNGTVSKYLIGLAGHLAGYSAADLNRNWDWRRNREENVAAGNMPSARLLAVSRLAMALLLAASLPLVFALGDRLGGPLVAYAASFLLATHAVVLVQARRALMEAPLLFFSLLTVWTAVGWAETWQRPEARSGWRRWSWPAALALASGLAVASKHNGVVPVAAGYLALATQVHVAVGSGARRARRLGALALSGLAAAGVFLALNPAWWDDPAERAARVLEMRRAMVRYQVKVFPDSAYPDATARLAGLAERLSGALPAVVPARGADGAQARAYLASPWAGLLHGPSLASATLGVMLFFASLLGLGQLVAAVRSGHVAARIVGLWGALSVAVLLATVPLAWQRYYMPVHPFQVLLAALGLAWLYERWWRRETGNDRSRAPLEAAGP